MLCLGIETSCDETSLALVENGLLIDNVIASQIDLHALFGGVVPELASREHYRYIGPLYDILFQRNNLTAANLDIIAAARGPGLLGSLLVGVAFAKSLALSLNKTLIGVNHLHAHLLAAGLEHELEFPALGLLASGGHTHIYLIESPWKFIQLGRTIDDAAGEAFDKIGLLLGFAYPAGKAIDAAARRGTADSKLLPRPFLHNENLDFSFSGLKTAASLWLKTYRQKRGEGQKAISQNMDDFCASLNLAIAETLCAKLERALSRYADIRQIILAGGVAANSLIREKFTILARKHKKKLSIPSIGLCTDNAAMIAYAGYLLGREGFYHTLEMEAIPRGMPMPKDMGRI